MLSTLRSRLHNDEDGFTLIELMVVVLIIAILIAIAIPTFLGVQNRAKDRAAQSDLRNGLTAAKTLATDNAGYFLDNSTPPVIIDKLDLKAVEGSLDWDTVAVAVAAGNQSKVGVYTTANGTNITLIKHSASGDFFSITADKDGVVLYCQDADSTKCDDGVADVANFKTKW